jgi:presqualene diphosphate synthase
MTAQEILAVEAKAKGSSFYAAMRLMPRAEREAMFAIYAFCRMVDDIADDGDGTREQRFAELTFWRRDLDTLYAGDVPVKSGFLKEAVARYGLRKEDFLAIIDGMEMDVHDTIVAPDLVILDLYCDRVASAVGRLSIKVFGMDEGPGFDLAYHLGRALQLTNILRDLDEDAGIDRLYLAREHLEAAGIDARDAKSAIADPRIDYAARATAALAHEHYAKADAVLRAKPKGRIATPRLMGAVYGEILRAMEAQGWVPPRKRVSLPKSRLLAIVLRNGLFG